MSNCKIWFQPDNIEVPAKKGENLLEVAARGKLHINASCGGGGVCGRCRVELISGELESEPGLHLSKADFDKGIRLACVAQVVGDAVIGVPEESRADNSAFTTIAASLEEEVKVPSISPMVRRVHLQLTPPSNGDNQSDYDRVLAALELEHGIKNPEAALNSLHALAPALREDGFNIDALLHDDDYSGQKRILYFRPVSRRGNMYAVAVDIGTTTVWAKLVNLETGQISASVGDLNAQISYGEDVISRMVFAGRGQGLKKLQEAVVGAINGLIKRLLTEQSDTADNIVLMTLAGNTTMSHLFVGVDPKNIRLAPYVPAVTTWPTLKPSLLGLDLPGYTVLKLLPSVSSYVGGDIISGVLASGLHTREELTLFIDIGTNGEIVVGNKDWMACAACSAGPAFEGGGVKFGMRAAPGAIDNFFLEDDRKSHRLSVINNERPIGICGSGLINIVAELFKAGVIDQRGKYNLDLSLPNIRQGDEGGEYLLCPADKSASGRDIVLTEIDIDNLMRAKGAMYSGYQTLLEGVGLSISELDKVIIAGGFGRSLNLANAITIGFLPELPLEKFTYIGNSSLVGATLVALSEEMWLTANQLKKNMTNFELSETPGYMDYYMASQFLPHTRGDLFPGVLAALKASKKASEKKIEDPLNGFLPAEDHYSDY